MESGDNNSMEDDNSMKGVSIADSMDSVTINKGKGLIDRLILYTKQILGSNPSALTDITEEEKLELLTPLSISSVNISTLAHIEGHGGTTVSSKFEDQYNLPPGVLLNSPLKGLIYGLSSPIGTVTLSTSCTLHGQSRLGDLKTFRTAIKNIFTNKKGNFKTGPIASSDAGRSAFLIDKLVAKRNVSNEANLSRSIVSKNNVARQVIEYEGEYGPMTGQENYELIEELKKHEPKRLILDNNYEFNTPNQNNEEVFSDPRPKIEIIDQTATQAGYDEKLKAVQESGEDKIYGYFVGAFVISNIVDGKASMSLSKQIIPKDGFFNAASINDWTNAVDIMGIDVIDTFEGENRKQLFIDRLLRAKDLIDMMITNFYIRTEENINQRAFKLDDRGNVLIGTTLSFYGYMVILSDFCYQVTNEGNLYGYNPTLIFNKCTTYEDFLKNISDRKNKIIYKNFIDNYTCASLNLNKSLSDRTPKDKRTPFLKNFIRDYKLFVEMLSQTDTQKEIEDMLEKQKRTTGDDFPAVLDDIVLKMSKDIAAEDLRNEGEKQKLQSYVSARQTYAPFKISTTIQNNKPRAPGSYSSISSSMSNSMSNSNSMSEEGEGEGEGEATQEEIDNFFDEIDEAVRLEEDELTQDYGSSSSKSSAESRYYPESPLVLPSKYKNDMDVSNLDLGTRKLTAKEYDAQKREAENITRKRPLKDQTQKEDQQRDFMFDGPNDPKSDFKTVFHPQTIEINKFQNMLPEDRAKYIESLEKKIEELENTKEPDPYPGFTETKTIMRAVNEEKQLLKRVKGIEKARVKGLVEASIKPDEGPENSSKRSKPMSEDWDDNKGGAGKRRSNKTINRKTKNAKKYKQKRRQTKKKPKKRRTNKRRTNNKRRTKRRGQKH